MNIDVNSPENRKLFDLMRADHPGLPAYVLDNCIRFYRAGVIDDMCAGAKKKRGRPPKAGQPPHLVPQPPSENIGAVTISDAA